jgi:hypothetical protein
LCLSKEGPYTPAPSLPETLSPVKQTRRRGSLILGSFFLLSDTGDPCRTLEV